MNFPILALSFIAVIFTSCEYDRKTIIERELNEYCSGIDAKIGVTAIIDGTDTVSLNGHSDFPMLSVYKFPQALAVADFCIRNSVSFDDSISIGREEIKPDTWSPLREKYGITDLRLPVSELVGYSVSESDNNACDILFRLIGGTAVADSVMKAAQFNKIRIKSTEDEMHADINLNYLNSSTPVEMAKLLDLFVSEMREKSPQHAAVAKMLEECQTGTDRLKHHLPPTVTLGHKTGTSDRDSLGRLIGVNDVGYVLLRDGRQYTVAVFVSGSSFSIEETSNIIAEVSKIIYSNIK